MWLSVEIAGGILLALLTLRVAVGFIDWLDARTSRISEAEARERARLTLAGKWPPKRSNADDIKIVAVVWALIGLGWNLVKWR